MSTLTPGALSPNSEAAEALRIVKAVRSIGLEIPKAVEDEHTLVAAQTSARTLADRELQAAVSRLREASADSFSDAAVEVSDAALHVWAVENGVHQVVTDVAVRRLSNRIFDASEAWETEVVGLFNAVVAEYKLNDWAEQLPDLTGKNGLNVLTLSANQGRAIEQWRNGAAQLAPLWSVYVKLARVHGTEVGARTSESLADNLFLACVLGDPGSFRTAETAATVAASYAGGASTYRDVGPVMPFVIPALVGYELRLHTIEQAQHVRSSIQTR